MTEYSMIPLLSAIIYIVLIAVVIVYRPLQKQHYFFLIYLVAALTWAIANSLLLSQFYMEQKLLLFRLTISASVWWAVQLYYFSRIFLKLNGGFGVKVGYTSLVCLIVFALLGYAPPDIIIDNGSFAGPVYGWWFYIYLFSLLFLAATIIYVLVQRFRATSNPVDRNKISYLTLAIGFWVLFGFIGITPLAQGGKFPITHIGGFLSAFVLAYAILKHELVSISAILRRSLGWALLFMVGVSIYVVILYALTLVFNHQLTTQALILATVSSILVSIFIYWLRPFFLTMVGYFFFRDTYTYRQMILSFDRDIGNIISLDELADKMLDLVLGALRVLKISLILRNPSNNDYITRYVYPTTKKLDEELKFDSDNPIIDWLEKETYPLNLTQIDNISQFEGLWQTEREVLVNSGIELLFPIKYRNELIGMLALGKKRGNTSYSHEDIELLLSMAGKAGIIIENARMFETLIQQQHQVQHLLTEAIQAQENERQRISADLHDSVAQWLAGASYQTQTVEALLPDTNGSNIRNQLNLVEETIDKSLTE